MADLINRQAAIDAISKALDRQTLLYGFVRKVALDAIKNLPSAQSEAKPIDYRDCANAMLKMWMDNVVTDGEYSRIMDKLNTYWRK